MTSRSCLPLIFALAGALFLASACTGGDPSPSATPATPTPSPLPSSVPLDLELAGRLAYEGEFERAIAIYSAVAQRSTQSERRQALWTLARLQYQRGDNSGAEQSLRALLDEEVTPELRRLARFLLGTVAFAQGKADEAEEAFKAYLETDGAASAYARLRLAELAAGRDDYNTATALTGEALADNLPPSVQTDARFSLASYQEDAGDIAGALATYSAIAADAPRLTPRGEALWLAADLAYRTGDAEAARQSLVSLVTLYPWHDRAVEALSHSALTSGVSLQDRALVLFSHRLNAEATDAFTSVLADPAEGDPADAHYHLGILAERAGNNDEALVQYDAAVALLPAGSNDALLGQNLWDRGLLFEALGRTEEAVADYASISDLAPTSEHAREALFRAGFLRFQQGLPNDATAFWQRLLAAPNDAASEARVSFWLAKVAADTGAARQHLRDSAAAAPLDYYGLRARAILDAETDFPAASETESAESDWPTIEEWLVSWAGPDITSDPPDPGEARARELLQAGLAEQADIEFEQLLEDAQGQPWALYHLLRTLLVEGRASLSARAAARLAPAHSDPPRALLALAYPVEYADIVNEQAVQNGFSPYLLLALVRQESFYDPNAVSSADAAGLTQVIPATAADIAEQLGDEDFHNADLLRPNVSLRFGAHYLGSQLELFEGDISAALAAYNGGPGNALRWSESASDPDVFLETIDLTETRAYVKLVLEHYAAYLYTYGLTDIPSLPLR